MQIASNGLNHPSVKITHSLQCSSTVINARIKKLLLPVIGASLSEPHTCEVNEPPVCIFVYMWRYDRQTPAPGPAAANFLIYCTLQKIFEFPNNVRINMAARSIVFFVRCYSLLIVGMVRLKAIHGNKT